MHRANMSKRISNL